MNFARYIIIYIYTRCSESADGAGRGAAKTYIDTYIDKSDSNDIIRYAVSFRCVPAMCISLDTTAPDSTAPGHPCRRSSPSPSLHPFFSLSPGTSILLVTSCATIPKFARSGLVRGCHRQNTSSREIVLPTCIVWRAVNPQRRCSTSRASRRSS